MIARSTRSGAMAMSSAVIVRPSEAFAHYARALECCAAIGARPLVARTEQAYGKALASAGKTDEAQPHLAAAQQLFGELGLRS